MSSHVTLTRTLGVLYLVMGTILLLVTLGVLSLNWELLRAGRWPGWADR